MDIQYFNREKNQIEIEKVYGESGIKWLYDSMPGKMLSSILGTPPLSKIYGSYQDMGPSKSKIPGFIEKFGIDMDEFLPDEDGTADSPYASFNNFFIRRFRPGVREFGPNSKSMPAPCEARYFGYSSIDDEVKIPVKGKFLSSSAILNDERWANEFRNGPLVIARLCPVDYHRFHFPDGGKVIDSYRVGGKLHSVNPIALKAKEDIFATNERHITILETDNFGRLAYVEVGAMMVGKIIQTFPDPTFARGDEKGYFLFGGSTVILIGEKGRWSPDQDILNYTEKGIEVYLKLGDNLAYHT